MKNLNYYETLIIIGGERAMLVSFFQITQYFRIECALFVQSWFVSFDLFCTFLFGEAASPC